MPAYRCPTCGHNDPTAFVRCYHPMCPDGRDQPMSADRKFDLEKQERIMARNRRLAQKYSQKSSRRPWGLLVAALLGLILGSSLATCASQVGRGGLPFVVTAVPQ